MRTAFDAKFNKIERTVEKIHTDIKKSFQNEPHLEKSGKDNINMISPINREDNIRTPSKRTEMNKKGTITPENLEKSLSLNFEKEKEGFNSNKDPKILEITPKLSKEVIISTIFPPPPPLRTYISQKP